MEPKHISEFLAQWAYGLDPDQRLELYDAVVDPMAGLDDEFAEAEKHQLTFAVDPSD